MKKNVTVKVELDQIRPSLDESGEDGGDIRFENVITTVSSEGEMELKNGVYTVKYTEAEMTGFPGCETTLTYTASDPSRITMSREGILRTVMMFSPGERYISVYETEFGSFEISVITESCENTADMRGGDIEILYTVEIRGAETERNHIKINIRAV